MSMKFNLRAFNVVPVLFLLSYHLFILVALPFYLWEKLPAIGMLMTMVVLVYLTGLSITAGYHRLYSHRSYKAHPIVEFFVLFFGTMAAQGSVLRWSFDHRLHHAHVDTDEDPYSIKKGFWYAHMLWLWEKPRPIDPKIVPDLQKNKLVMFQHHYYGALLTLTNAITVFSVGWIFNDYFGAFLFAFALRTFILHHCTWFINSLAHTWGDKPFCQEQSAVNNYIIAILTFGEGYHNFHHTFANDYRNGIRWYHFDPTKWLIWSLNKIGFAWDLKLVDHATISRRLIIEKKQLLNEKLENLWYVKKEELEKNVNELVDKILEELNRLASLKKKYREFKRSYNEKTTLIAVKKELKRLHKQVKGDLKAWRKLSKHILRLKPLPQ